MSVSNTHKAGPLYLGWSGPMQPPRTLVALQKTSSLKCPGLSPSVYLDQGSRRASLTQLLEQNQHLPVGSQLKEETFNYHILSVSTGIAKSATSPHLVFLLLNTVFIHSVSVVSWPHFPDEEAQGKRWLLQCNNKVAVTV